MRYMKLRGVREGKQKGRGGGRVREVEVVRDMMSEMEKVSAKVNEGDKVMDVRRKERAGYVKGKKNHRNEEGFLDTKTG